MTKNASGPVRPEDFSFHQRYWETDNCGLAHYGGRAYISRTGEDMEDFNRHWLIYADDDAGTAIGRIHRCDVQEDGQTVHYYTPYDAVGVGQTLVTGLTSFKAALAEVINADQLRRHAQVIEDAITDRSDH